MLKDVHQVPDEVYEFYKNAYGNFSENDFKTLESERSAFDLSLIHIFPEKSIEKSSKFRISMRWAFPHLISSPQLCYRLLHQEKVHLQDEFLFFFPE